MNLTFESYRACRLCPRNCSVNRTQGKTGYCGETVALRVATLEPHFGEEPPISGTNGSGTVFFSGCSLKCCYCQNFQISIQGFGFDSDMEQVAARLNRLYQNNQIHNVNFVTPDHFFPHCVQIVQRLRASEVPIPIVYNLSGYQKQESIRDLADFADIYLVDYKYSNTELARQLSNAPDYPTLALEAIGEMVRQKGYFDTFKKDLPVASRGTIVRHLILPGHIQNSLNALTTLFLEFGSDLPLSLMSQYTPIPVKNNQFPNRPLKPDEFNPVYEHIQSLGFKNLFVQFPDEKSPSDHPFLPDFQREQPFMGNIR